MKKEQWLTYFMNISFYIYFAILIAERSISVAKSFMNGIEVFSSAYNCLVYVLIFLSIGSFILYLGLRCGKSLIALFVPNEDNLKLIDFKSLVLASGILLISGMVHSEYTVAPIQFVSYGFYILAIILKVVCDFKECPNKPLLIISTIYLVCFSMAIPVSYPTTLEHAGLFYGIEFTGSIVLVFSFTVLTYYLFDGKYDLFFWTPLVVMIGFDVTILALRWIEEINYFVLIFAGLSILLFIPGIVLQFIEHTKVKQEQ